MVEVRKPEAAGAPAVRVPDPAVADVTSAMVPRFNVFFRWFAKRFFPYFDLDDGMVARGVTAAGHRSDHARVTRMPSSSANSRWPGAKSTPPKLTTT